MTDLKAHLDRLEAEATGGHWCQFGLCRGPYQAEARAAYDRGEYGKIDTSHHMSAVKDGEPYRIATWNHARDAAFAEALVNAYRAGKLVVADAEDQYVAGFEACRERAAGECDMAAHVVSHTGSDDEVRAYQAAAKIIRALQPRQKDKHDE